MSSEYLSDDIFKLKSLKYDIQKLVSSSSSDFFSSVFDDFLFSFSAIVSSILVVIPLFLNCKLTYAINVLYVFFHF